VKRDFTEAQLRQGHAIIGLQMGIGGSANNSFGNRREIGGVDPNK
jgi:hypothetical protein